MKLMSILIFIAIAGCGGRSHNGSTAATPQNEEPTPTPAPRPSTPSTYRATLRPVNSGISPSARGVATIRIQQDDFSVNLSASNLENSVHMQHIHMASRCPTMAADKNSDGFVDAMEARAVTGPGIIPLDGDLNSQEAASGSYPSGSSYSYAESSSLQAMMNDLRQRELDSDNSVVRLGPGGNLNLADRVIVVHGADPSTNLPATVASYNGVPAQDTIPVACGEINKVP